jgi:HEAT repeat protein
LPSAFGQSDEASLQGRTLTQWMALMRGEEHLRKQRAAMHVMGCGGENTDLWRPWGRTRTAGVIASRIIVLQGKDSGRTVLPAIAATLRADPDTIVRVTAAQSLGDLIPYAQEREVRIGEALDAVIGTLRLDPSGDVRHACATALGKVDPATADTAVSILAQTLQDPDPRVGIAAADTLRRFGKHAADAVNALTEVVRNPEAQALTRMQCALALGQIGPDALKAVDVFKHVLVDTQAPLEVRAAVAEGLGMLGPDAAAASKELVKVVGDPMTPLRLRRAAATALDRFGEAARPVLTDLLKAIKDDDKFVRCLVMHAVGQMGPVLGEQSTEAVNALLRGVDDNVLEVRVTAIETLGNLGKAHLGKDADVVIKRLQQLQRDTQKEIRDAADIAMMKLQPSS